MLTKVSNDDEDVIDVALTTLLLDMLLRVTGDDEDVGEAIEKRILT